MKNIGKIIRKNSELSIIIVVLLLLGIVLLSTSDIVKFPKSVNTLSLSSDLDNGIISIKEIRFGDLKLINKPLAIYTDKQTYVQGNIATLTDYQNINLNCNNLKSTFQLIQEGIPLPLSKTSKNHGKKGLMTAYYTITVDTSTLTPDKYNIEAIWECDGLILNSAGYKDPIARYSSTSQFTLLDKSTPPPPTNLCNIRSCNIGQHLENPNSINCYCKNDYVIGDGICSPGEPSLSIDCKPVPPSHWVFSPSECLPPMGIGCTDENKRCVRTISECNVIPPPPPNTKQCSDTVDNDNDTLIDMKDPGCENAEDDDETNQKKKFDIKLILIILAVGLIGYGIYIQNRR